MDRISNLPDNLIGLILDELSIIDRVKTSVLSRSWRKRWTSLSSVIFDEDFFFSVRGCVFLLKCANIINSLLLQCSGGFKEFYLNICNCNLDQPSCLLLESSTHYVTKSSSLERLYLVASSIEQSFALPSATFSAVNLRVLDISCFQFHPPFWFDGFPNLTHFRLDGVTTSVDAISHFVSVCPQLEEVELFYVEFADQDLCHVLGLKAPKLSRLDVSGEFIHVSVSNAQNLKSASMSIHQLPGEDVSRSEDMLSMFNNSMQLQHISFNGLFCEFLGRCRIVEMLPTFGQMKSLEFVDMVLRKTDDLQCFLSFCASSPGVRCLELGMLDIAKDFDVGPPELVSMVENYINKDFRHLVKVEIIEISGTQIEMKIIELLLRFSPVLEVMQITFNVKKVQKFKKLHKAVKQYHQASTKTKFQIFHVGNGC